VGLDRSLEWKLSGHVAHIVCPEHNKTDSWTPAERANSEYCGISVTGTVSSRVCLMLCSKPISNRKTMDEPTASVHESGNKETEI
jgi:hypothetical protein